VERSVGVVRQHEQRGVQVVRQHEQRGVQVVRQLEQRGVQVVRQLEQRGVQGVARNQKASHRNVCAKKIHSRNNRTFLAGLNFSLLGRLRGEAWKLNPEKVRDNNRGLCGP